MKKTIKKTAAVLLACMFVLSLLLTGCGNKRPGWGDDGTGPQIEDGEDVTLPKIDDGSQQDPDGEQTQPAQAETPDDNA